MIGGSALASRAVGDTARRDLPSAWGGPDPSAAADPVPIVRERVRRIVRDRVRRIVPRKP